MSHQAPNRRPATPQEIDAICRRAESALGVNVATDAAELAACLPPEYIADMRRRRSAALPGSTPLTLNEARDCAIAQLLEDASRGLLRVEDVATAS